MTTNYKFFQIDAFSRVAFKGNPAAVFLLDRPLKDQLLQSIASEMNLSETAFLWKTPTKGRYALRWFTPTTEVDLCGHATLASAHMLYSEGLEPHAQTLDFETKSGVLTAEKRDSHLCLAMPSKAVRQVESTEALRSCAPDALAFYAHEGAYLAEFSTEANVRGFKPDAALISALDRDMLIITAPAASNQVHFVSRVFCPKLGIAEDPVTGAAHCALAPFWMAKLDNHRLVGEQLSQRGGVVHVMQEGDRLLLAGLAVTTVRGLLTL